MVFLLALLAAPLALADEAAEPVLPQVVAQDCTTVPAETGLHHLRCGQARLLVAQLSTVEADVHDELLLSVLDLVPGPASRSEVDLGDADLRRTRVVQSRQGVDRDELTVHLLLTTRHSTGRSVACVVGQVGRKRADRAELDWCESMTRALLPAPPVAPTTRIEVQAPDLPGDDAIGTDDDGFSG